MIKDEYSTREIDALLRRYGIGPDQDGKRATALTVWPRFGTLRAVRLRSNSAYRPAVRTRFGRPLLDGGQWADLLRDTASPRFSAEPPRPRPRAQRLAPPVVTAPEPEPVFRGMARCPCGWTTEWHYGDQAAVTDWVEARRMQHWKITGHSPRI